MNKVEVFNEYKDEIKEIETVKKLIDYAIKYKNLKKVEFNVIFVDNAYIHQLNLNYRNIDRPTDVISFALEDNKDNLVVSENRILGDIYISIDKAREQAEEYGHSFLREICFLTIHGFLHLLGYDHMTKEDEEIMFKEQEDILDGFGIKR